MVKILAKFMHMWFTCDYGVEFANIIIKVEGTSLYSYSCLDDFYLIKMLLIIIRLNVRM